MDTLYQTVPYEDIAYIQNCITLNFEDRDILDKSDLDIIKKLGLKFRGRKQWPQFRNYKPGFFPWYLDRNEVKYMTYVLEQVVQVALRCKEDKDIIICETDEEILVRVPANKKGTSWEDTYMTLEFEEDEFNYGDFDELALKRVKDNKIRISGVWEVDFFHAPAMVKEEDRPYYPLVFIIADSETGMTLDMVMTSDFKGYAYEFQDCFIQLLGKNRVIPDTIVVQRKSVFNTFEPLAKKLGIRIEPVEELVVVQEFRMGLERFL
jgi:hypothetical protein